MKIRVYKKRKKEYLLEFIYVTLIFQMALQSSSNYIIAKVFNYIDDIIALCCLGYVLLNTFREGRISKDDKKIVLTFFLFAVIGIIGTIQIKIQPFMVCASDLFTCLKFIAGYLAARVYYKNYSCDALKRSVLFITKILTIVFFVLAMNDEFLHPIFEIFDYRLIGRSINLFYPHPTYLAAACIVFLLVLAVTNRRKENYIYMFMISIVIIFTFRVKAISFVAVFWGLYLMIEVWKIKSKLVYIFVSLLLAGYLAYDQFTVYFLSDTWSARAVLFTDAVMIAKKYFPFGSGYASFGTNMSVVSYSPIYYQLGYNKINGMSKETAAYLNDGFWQACLAQFGIIGVIFFIIIIYLFLKKTLKYKISDVGPMRYFATISLNVYLIIASVGEMAYFAPYALLYFIVLGIIFDENDRLLIKERKIK